ncbi:MAG: ferric reductase-like transmembrane domain-containing protein [Giesbergeria sp.]
MRSKVALGIWLLGITLAWMAVAPADLGVSPLVNAQGAALGWWQLRQHAIYLSGLWSIGLMALVMLLALRLPLFDRVLGGMDQVYRLHKWAGIAAALTAIVHWGAKESSGWIKTLWGRAGKPGHDAVLPWLTDTRGFAKDLGEWAFYLLLAMVALTLLARLLPYKHWRLLHRAMPVLFLALVFHAVALMPLTFWALPLGLLMGSLLALGSLAALWSLAGWVGRSRNHVARIQSVAVLGDTPTGAPIEVICAMPKSWRGHRAGQFVFVRFDAAEGAHPFTIASAPHALGNSPEGEPLLRLVIKPLGDYTRTLHQRLHAGQRVDIEGPYGRFHGKGSRRRQQVWVAAGVGVTPFLALLEARQPGVPAKCWRHRRPHALLHPGRPARPAAASSARALRAGPAAGAAHGVQRGRRAAPHAPGSADRARPAGHLVLRSSRAWAMRCTSTRAAPSPGACTANRLPCVE